MTTAEAVRPAAAISCAHCGLPVPRGLVHEERPEQFCCGGCRAAFELIQEGGLERYYTRAERRDAPVRSSGRGYEEFDHEAFRIRYVTLRPDGLAETELFLEGVHCASCVWLVERVPLLLPGAVSAELDVSRSTARLAWDPARVPLSRIARTLDTLGYSPHPHRGLRTEAVRRAEDRRMLTHIGVAGALAGNVMLVALALYAGWFTGIDPGTERYFRYVSLALTTPALFWPGRVFFRGAWGAIRAGTLHMDVPVALALGAGFLRGLINTLRDAGPVYFDGVAALIFLLLVGRFLQHRAQRSATGAADLLRSLAPATARVLEGDETGPAREVPAEAVVPGMLLEVRAGDTVAADGTVEAGQSELDLSLLTGETHPVLAGPGDRVFAATVNRTSTLRLRVEATGEESRVGCLLREVEAGARRRSPTVRLADRLTAGFIAVVLVLAAATYVWWLGAAPARALDNAIALLIVTCPCALALATPLAVTVAIGRAARTGTLIRSGAALEALARPGRLYLDKTGTLTEGRSSLRRWEGEERARPLVLAVERHSSHPLAAGFAAAWPGLPVPEARNVATTPGGGIEGDVGLHRVAVGSPAYVARRLDRVPSAPEAAELRTEVWVAVDGRLEGQGVFSDQVRPGAAETMDALRRRGFRPFLLSGDAQAVVRSVGRATGFAEAECLGARNPEEKLAEIERAARSEPVVMVGDGVNDAAAIARATVGIAVRGGAEASLTAADVYLGGGIGQLEPLMEGARRTLLVIRRNIAFSLLYNVAGAALAMTGVINPLIAAIMMPASSLTVVLASWWSRTFEPGSG